LQNKINKKIVFIQVSKTIYYYVLETIKKLIKFVIIQYQNIIKKYRSVKEKPEDKTINHIALAISIKSKVWAGLVWPLLIILKESMYRRIFFNTIKS
jgi:hypothetical protein